MNRLINVATVLALSVIAHIPHADAQPPAVLKKHALLVGVNVYNVRKFNQPEPLKYAERDVGELAEVLTKAGYDVTLLVGSGTGTSKATRANIVSARAALLKKVSPQHDLVLVGLSGHGVQREIKDAAGRIRETPFYCPVDADLIADTGQVDPASLIDLNETIRLLNDKGGRNNLLLVDACRDDASKPKGGKFFDGNTVENLAEGNAIFFASSSGRRAFETDKAGGGHGIFFHTVIEGLNGAAADRNGNVTWDRLVTHLRDNVDDRVAEWIGKDYEQRPQGVANLIGRSPILLTGSGERSRAVEKSVPPDFVDEETPTAYKK